MGQWSEMFPDGRCLFYEGETPEVFAREMLARFNFDPRKNNTSWNEDCGYFFLCPASCLDEIYGNGRYPLGS